MDVGRTGGRALAGDVKVNKDTLHTIFESVKQDQTLETARAHLIVLHF